MKIIGVHISLLSFSPNPTLLHLSITQVNVIAFLCFIVRHFQRNQIHPEYYDDKNNNNDIYVDACLSV